MQNKRIGPTVTVAFALLLALDAEHAAAAEYNEMVRVDYRKSGTLLPVRNDGLAPAGPKATAAVIGPKLGLGLPVRKRREARKQRCRGEPLSGQAIAHQQEVADTFFELD